MKTIQDYQGKILFKHTHYNFSMDLDEHTATVWDDELEIPMVHWCERDTTPDATPEVWQKYFQHTYTKTVDQFTGEEECNAIKIEKGKELRVIRGRKYPKGLTGLCFWAGTSKYGYRTTYRAGMTLKDGETVWIDQYNVEVVDPKEVNPEEVKTRALEDTIRYAQRLGKEFAY